MERKLKTHFEPLEDIEQELREADNNLPEDVKTSYPVQSMEDLKEKHKERWIAVLVTSLDENLWPTSGRLVATAGKYDRPKLEREIKPLEDRVNRALHIFYTGKYDFLKENN